MKKLQVAYSRKEKLEKLISNLENLKKEDDVTAEQYESISNNYRKLHNMAVKAIEDIKSNLKNNLNKKQNELENLKQDLDNLAVRFKIGEMTDSNYQKSQERINKTIQTRQKEINTLEALITTESSSDVGGYTEVNIEAPKGFTSIVGGMLPSSLSETSEMSNGISTKPYLISLILGVIMFIGIFLPWISADIGFGYSETANGTEYGWGILSLIMSIFCILLSFVTITRIKGIGLIVSGILAAIGVIAYWFSARGELGIYGMQEIISPSFGLIITALTAIGVVVTGVIQYRQQV